MRVSHLPESILSQAITLYSLTTYFGAKIKIFKASNTMSIKFNAPLIRQNMRRISTIAYQLYYGN
jgi:hypothetical protein